MAKFTNNAIALSYDFEVDLADPESELTQPLPEVTAATINVLMESSNIEALYIFSLDVAENITLTGDVDRIVSISGGQRMSKTYSMSLKLLNS